MVTSWFFPLKLASPPILVRIERYFNIIFLYMVIYGVYYPSGYLIRTLWHHWWRHHLIIFGLQDTRPRTTSNDHFCIEFCFEVWLSNIFTLKLDDAIIHTFYSWQIYGNTTKSTTKHCTILPKQWNDSNRKIKVHTTLATCWSFES